MIVIEKAKKQGSKEVKKVFSFLLISLLLCFMFFSPQDVQAKTKKPADSNKKEETEVKKEPINESDFHPVLIGALLENPQSYIGKKIKLRGKFSSFTTLALDYKPAMRSSKDYISICIFRTDSKIPLSELKLAYPVKEAKENLVIRELEEGDLLEIYGEVFSAALDEPWVDISLIKEIESAQKKPDAAEVGQLEKSKDKKTDTEKEVKKKKNKAEKNEKESR